MPYPLYTRERHGRKPKTSFETCHAGSRGSASGARPYHSGGERFARLRYVDARKRPPEVILRVRGPSKAGRFAYIEDKMCGSCAVGGGVTAPARFQHEHSGEASARTAGSNGLGTGGRAGEGRSDVAYSEPSSGTASSVQIPRGNGPLSVAD